MGVDISELPGAGAAGGLAGGLVVAGAQIVGGFDLVAQTVGLEQRIAVADLVMTGEGRLDLTSWEGKVVAGVGKIAEAARKDVVVVAGQVARDALEHELLPSSLKDVIDMSEVFGSDTAMREPQRCAALASQMLLERASSY
jgi:glycerate kinase